MLHSGSTEISRTLSSLRELLVSWQRDLDENQVITAEGLSAVLGTQVAISTQRDPQCGLRGKKGVSLEKRRAGVF